MCVFRDSKLSLHYLDLGFQYSLGNPRDSSSAIHRVILKSDVPRQTWVLWILEAQSWKRYFSGDFWPQLFKGWITLSTG